MKNDWEWNLAQILHAILNAAAARDWEKVENKAEDLKIWARAAEKAITDPGANEQPGDGGK